MNSRDPLADLLVDADELDRAGLARALRNRVAIDKASARLQIADGYASLDSKRKLLALLLAQKAAHLLDMSETESLSHSAMVAMSGMPKGTAAPTLKGLKETHLVAQDESKAYYVPNASLLRAIRLFDDNGGAS